MELRALRYFVTVADELHFGRAAERLHIAQPAVSRRIAALERELGVRLLDRSPRRVRLTEAGRRVLAAAREALAAVDRVRVAARECAGVMRIGTGAGQFTARLERGIDALRERPRDSTSCSSTCR
ncbi:LysR family transcriptional regulator [Amycolatopsis methanolica]|uniref:LysR family transcriptional regulator n=1 Tax=Amycolatopsis methanolica TaxID=1814 RepID=UPI0003AA410F